MFLRDLAALFCLFTLPLISHATLSQTSRMLSNDYVAKSGNITIHQTSLYYFYVDVDFDYYDEDASDSDVDDPSMARMTLSLYTSQTIIPQIPPTRGCLGFENYNCTIHQCTPYPTSPSNLTLPTFEILEGYYANATVILDYSNWKLNTNATIATNCSYTGEAYGYGTFGLLGLGLNGSQANFINTSSMFSIWMDKYVFGVSGGILSFSSNTSVISSSVYVGSLQASADWHILSPVVQITIGDTFVSSFNGINAIFDINMNAIGVPTQIFSAIIQSIESKEGADCSGFDQDYSYPMCTLSSTIQYKDLPTITLTIQNIPIDIPPALYVEGFSPDEHVGAFTLRFRALDPLMDDVNYVTPEYKNYIIFDRYFMSFYYSEFSFADNNYTISLYNTYKPDSDSVIWPYIVGGAIGLLLLVGVIIFYVKKRRSNKIKDQGANKDIINDSSQHLLAVNSKPNGLNSVENYRQRKNNNEKYESWIAPEVPLSS